MGTFPNPAFSNHGNQGVQARQGGQGVQARQGGQGPRHDIMGPNRTRPLIPGRRPEPYNKV